MDYKIRILFMSANPTQTGRIRVDEEAREIGEMIEKSLRRDDFELIHQPAFRPGDLPHLLMKHRPHIVHFSGHGSATKEIVAEGAGGRSKRIRTAALVELFKVHGEDVRVVVLNACLTQPAAQALTEVVDYAIGIKKFIGDQAAVKFAGAFYLALGNGNPIPKAFASAKASLNIQSVRQQGGAVLLLREGVDQSAPFPPPDGDTQAKLKAALLHLIAGHATEDETNLVRQATKEGALSWAQVEEAVEGEAGIVDAARAEGGGRALRVEVGVATYRRLQERLFPPPPGLGPPVPNLIFIGREDSMSKVKGLLQPASGARPELSLTVVRGWPGVGKTTLVGVLGRDPEMLKTFPDGVLWTSLERQPELMTKLAQWGRELGTDELLRTPTLDEAVVKLHALLRHRRMLLIVDDIWNAEHAVPFMRAASSSLCAMLATTRKTSVAQVLTTDSERVYNLPILTEENSLILLHHIVPEIVERYREECRRLVTDLGCLPLALHVAGRLLREESDMGLNIVDFIEGIRDGAKLFPEPAPLDRAEGAVLPSVHALLKRSTDELDPLTRECFAFLGPFAPKPYTFSLAAMSAQWRLEDPLPVVRKLVGHGLLERVGESRFQMHELLVQHANSLLSR
jgi:hypothetical protein